MAPMAYISEELKSLGAKMLWTKGLDESENKILALRFNFTINIARFYPSEQRPEALSWDWISIFSDFY